MSGSLIKIDEEIVTSAVASVSLVGIDSTYDVYMVKVNNIQTDTDTAKFQFRVTTSGTPQTDTNYDRATKLLQAHTTFGNVYDVNQTNFDIVGSMGTATGEQSNLVMYCFNFNNASEYSFGTIETVDFGSSARIQGQQGGFVKTTTEANDGLHFYMTTGNFTSGSTFTLYGLKK